MGCLYLSHDLKNGGDIFFTVSEADPEILEGGCIIQRMYQKLQEKGGG